jgi:hypothetical protein
VDELIGPHTVNTLPDTTLEAFDDHGRLGRTIDAELDAARKTWDDIANIGVDHAGVAAQLEREGVSSFQKSFDELIDALGVKAEQLRASPRFFYCPSGLSERPFRLRTLGVTGSRGLAQCTDGAVGEVFRHRAQPLNDVVYIRHNPSPDFRNRHPPV